MTEKVEYMGYWFLPNNPENKVAGKLTFLPNDKIVLELFGGFGEQHDDPMLDFFEKENFLPIIHGITSDAKEITLMNGYASGTCNFSAPFPVIRYNCRYMLVGIWLSDIEALSFDKLKISFSELNDWIGQSIIKYNNDNSGINFSLSTREQFTEDVPIDNDTTLSLVGYGPHRIERFISVFSTKTYCEFTCTNGKKSLTSLLDNTAWNFKQFLSLATLSPVTYSDITLYSNDIFQELDNDRKYIHPIKLYYIEHNPPTTAKIDRLNFLFDYLNIREDFPVIIKKWYAEAKALDIIRERLLSSIHYTVFDSTVFLIIVQALEGYCKKFVDKNKHLREHIEGIILSFSDIECIQEYQKHLDIAAIVDSRNYYTHLYLTSNKAKILEEEELFSQTMILRVVLICCVLRVIGFENSKINEVFNKCQNRRIKISLT
jgi:hypothetical protein